MTERRYHGLDALRGSMMMLGIVLHGAVFYMAAPPLTMPIPTDRNHSPGFDIVFHFIHSFRMPTFFVLAGFFTALLVAKRGMWGTYRNRGARVLAPLLAGIVTVLPVTGLFALDFMLSARFGVHDILPDLKLLHQLGTEIRATGMPVERPGLGHLWFLYYLCYFYLLIPVCRFLVERTRSIASPIQALIASPWGLVVLSLYTAATLWPFRGGQVHEGFIFLAPHLPSLLYFGSFFVLGYLFHTYSAFLDSAMRHAHACALSVVVLFPLSLYVSHLEHIATGPAPGVHLAAVIVHAFCTWALIYAFVGFAQRYFDRESPWILYTSQSSYWVFLMHMPALAFAAWWLVQYDLPALVKFLLATSFTTVVCFTSYHYLVQRTWVSQFLNGRRFDLDWPWRGNGGTKDASTV